ncbi:unnamed protein product [Tenebrio molitor]|jgi:hypothetical protein|nr:unnamed protein product [Tenebrio molitor]
MAVVPCPKAWQLPLTTGYFPNVEQSHHRTQVIFFSHLLPGLNIREVKPIYRREPPHCGWEICCFYQGPVNNEGLADHINQIVQCNKYGNVTVGDINFNSFNNFSVVYNVNCECNVADF